MKTIVVLLFLFTVSVQADVLSEGAFECVNGNSNLICPHKVKLYHFDNTLTGLKVTYIGDCEGQGSNIFGCEKLVCTSGAQVITIKKSNMYHWEHRAYNFYCDFQYFE